MGLNGVGERPSFHLLKALLVSIMSLLGFLQLHWLPLAIVFRVPVGHSHFHWCYCASTQQAILMLTVSVLMFTYAEIISLMFSYVVLNKFAITVLVQFFDSR
jgi:hypothetical protein